MAHTKIFSIKHYKNLVQKTHFIKYFKRTYKGHNLATLKLGIIVFLITRGVQKSLNRSRILMYSSDTSVSSRVVKNINF